MTADAVADTSAADPLERLLAVQDLDTVIGQLQHRRAALPERSRLAEVQSTLTGLASQAAALEMQHQELANRQSDLEGQIAATVARRQTIEQRLYAARGAPSRDLQAMDEEIHHLTIRQSELEDVELEVMEELEPLDATLSVVARERDELQSAVVSLSAAVAEAETTIDGEISLQTAAREAAAAGLPPDLRQRYESLRTKMGGTGAARLVGNRCSGCHLELPSMEVERIRHVPPGTVVTCEQCGRILVPSAAPSGTPGPPTGPGSPAAPGPSSSSSESE